MPGTGRYLRSCAFVLFIMMLCAIILGLAYKNYYRSAYPVKYNTAVKAGSQEYGLPESLIYAVIHTESGFRPNVKSSAGAVGLMQITKDTFMWTQYRLGEEPLNFDELLNGETSIRYGSALLRLLIDEFGSLENALCAYHAGWGSAKEWLANPEHSPDGIKIEHIPFGDTKKYVKKVLKTKAVYERLYRMDDIVN